MSEASETLSPANACLACKQHKRKCDKAVPRCGTCLRVGRDCVYETSPAPSSVHQPSSNHSRTPASVHNHVAPSIPAIGVLSSGIDPYRYEALRRPTIDTMFSLEAAKMLGDLPQVKLMAEHYFASSYIRMPVLSKSRFFQELPNLFSIPRADFILLCLSIHLLMQYPKRARQVETMQSSLYVTLKTYIAILEAANYVTLRFVQARILVTFYEMGHAIYPVASASIAACARTAHHLGLNQKEFQDREHASGQDIRTVAEEEKRTWWAVLNLDRFIALCTGEKVLVTEDAEPGDSLPIDDERWSQNHFPEAHSLNLLTPADITAGPFARECQILHLVGRVMRHVFDPPSDTKFLKEEAAQLQRTLNAFLPLLMVEEERFGFYCAALGMCGSALITLCDSAILSNNYNENEQRYLQETLESTSSRVATLSCRLFLKNVTAQRSNPDLFSPLVPHAIYQAAVVQYRWWKQTGLQDHKDNMDAMRTILAGFGKRWQVGDVYTQAFDSLTTSSPSTILFVQDRLWSTNRPADDSELPDAI